MSTSLTNGPYIASRHHRVVINILHKKVLCVCHYTFFVAWLRYGKISNIGRGWSETKPYLRFKAFETGGLSSNRLTTRRQITDDYINRSSHFQPTWKSEDVTALSHDISWEPYRSQLVPLCLGHDLLRYEGARTAVPSISHSRQISKYQTTAPTVATPLIEINMIIRGWHSHCGITSRG